MSLDLGFERSKLAGRAGRITSEVGGELRQPVLFSLCEIRQRLHIVRVCGSGESREEQADTASRAASRDSNTLRRLRL